MSGRGLLGFSSGPELTFHSSLLVWIVLTQMSLYCVYEQHARARRVQRDIISTLTAGVVCRLFWFGFAVDENGSWTLILVNRASILLQCTGVMLLLLLWVKGMVSSVATFQIVKKCMFGLIAAMWLFLISTTIAFQYICNSVDCVWYAINLVFVGFASFCVAFSTLCYGLYVRRSMTQSVDEEYMVSAGYVARKRLVQQLLVVCAVLVVCFSARAFCFLLTFFHQFTGAHLYPWFFYQIPEFIPHVTILVGLAPSDGIFKHLHSIFSSALNRESETFKNELARDSSLGHSSIQMSIVTNPLDQSN